MAVLVLSGAEVRRLLPPSDCIAAVERALAALARGDAVQPLRAIVRPAGVAALLASMPAWLGDPPALGIKTIGVGPRGHRGAVLLFGVDSGDLEAVVDADAITAIRTAAASALATRELARGDASDLAILGCGVQAASHLEAIASVRRLRRVRVWSRNAPRAREFAARHASVAPVEASQSAEAAVRGADIVCTVTASPTPVLLGAWLSPGAHVNAVGACLPACRELDTEAVVRSRFFVDRRESALAEAGDFLIPRREGAVTDDHILGELADVVSRRVPGRRTPEDLTVFESLGIAVEDLAAASVVVDRARSSGAGTSVEL